jgi:glycosyltransferase involved in cell wall biosynthesis
MRSSPNYAMYLGDLDRRRTSSQGIISFSLRLTAAVAAALERDEALTVIASNAIRGELGELPSAGRVEIVDVRPVGNVAERVYRDQIGAQLVARTFDPDVMHFPKGLIPWWRPARTKVLATVHDDIPMQYAAGAFGPARRNVKRAYVTAAFQRTLRRADVVFTDSEFSRTALEAAVTGSVRAPIEVVVPGLGLEAPHPLGARVRANTLLVFDSALPHKYAHEAASFATRYLFEHRLDDHQVLLVGDGAAARLCDQFPDRVRREPGPLDNTRLAELVRTARAVAIASRYEGLGLPALEAWALGTPAVVADSGAAREVLRGLPGVYRAGDYGSFAAQLDHLLALDQRDYDAYATTVDTRCDWTRAAEQVLGRYRAMVRR